MAPTLGAGSVPGLGELAALDVDQALDALGGSVHGLDRAEAARRLEVFGPNAVRSHRVRPFAILLRQFSNPIQLLLLGAAGVSLVVGERVDAAIVTVIVLLSVMLGFVTEFRSERAIEALHDRVRHRATVRRVGAELPEKSGALFFSSALRTPGGDFVTNPKGTTRLEADHVIIAVGTDADLGRLAALNSPR